MNIMEKKYLKLSQILKRLLFEKNIRPSNLAKKLKMPLPTIHRIVTGKSTRPHQSSLNAIAKYFKVSVKQLIGEEALIYETFQPIFSSSPNLVKTIPLINWKDINNINNLNKTNIKQNIAVGNKINDHCFALIMNDHSMSPLFPKETILIFDPTKKLTDRSYILVKLKEIDIPIFRELLIDIDYKYLKPLNPDLNIYKMRVLMENDIIIACLVESRINYDFETDNNILDTI